MNWLGLSKVKMISIQRYGILQVVTTTKYIKYHCIKNATLVKNKEFKNNRNTALVYKLEFENYRRVPASLLLVDFVLLKNDQKLYESKRYQVSCQNSRLLPRS